MLGGVGAPWPPSRAALGQPAVPAADQSVWRATRTPRSVAGKASGSPRPRIAMTSAVHGPIPGRASSCLRACVPVAAGVQHYVAVGQCGDKRGHGRWRRARERRVGRGRCRRVRRPTERHASVRRSRRRRVAIRGHEPPAWVRRGLHRHLLTQHHADGQLGFVDGARNALARAPWPPVRRAPIGAQERRSTASGSASRSSRRRQRAMADGQVAEVVEHQHAPDMIGRRRQADDSVAVRQPQRPPVGAVAHLLAPGTAVAARWPNSSLVGERLRGPAAAGTGCPAGGPRLRSRLLAVARCAASVGVRSQTARTVSLNWRMLEKPAAKATSPNGRSVVSISTRAVWARCARASASGLAPTSACSRRSSWRVV